MSPCPANWTSTTVDEQADDLAALIDALDAGPAAVFGTSSGASIVLNLLLRHPGVVCGSIVHEPMFEALIEPGSPAQAEIDRCTEIVAAALESGGPRAGMEAFVRAIVGDAAYEARDPIRRERTLATAATWFDIEAPVLDAWLPDPAALGRVTVPTMIGAGAVDMLAGGFRLSSEWVARQMGTVVHEFPGAHTPYLDHAGELVGMIRPFFRDVHRRVDRGMPGSARASRSGEDLPIVLVPGGLSGWHSWRPMAEELARERTVIRTQLLGLDLAGSGQPIPDDYATETETSALLAAVDAQGLDQFDLAGWSLGGQVALDFALTHPERVRTLTLIEPAAPWLLRETGYPREELARLERTDREMRGRTITPDDLRAFIVRAGLAQLGDNFETHPSWPVWMRHRQIVASLGMIWEYGSPLQRLNELETPVLAVYGAASTPDEIALTREIAVRAPRATLLELPGDHACHLQDADAFLDAMRSLHDSAGIDTVRV